jgi:hypothetical protein
MQPMTVLALLIINLCAFPNPSFAEIVPDLDIEFVYYFSKINEQKFQLYLFLIYTNGR